jgi:4-carboxymuconolactone decarboxylase
MTPNSDQDFDVAAREAEILGKPQRIPPLKPEEFDDEAKALVVNIRKTLGLADLSKLPEVFGLMLKSPAVYRAQMDMGIALFKSAIPPRERELAILRVGWLCRAPYEWGEHVDIAKRYGMSSEEIDRVRQGSSARGWTEHEAAIIRGVEELLEDKMISDATWTVLARSWTERQLLEFPTLVGQYVATAFLQNSLRVRLAPDNPGLTHR